MNWPRLRVSLFAAILAAGFSVRATDGQEPAPDAITRFEKLIEAGNFSQVVAEAPAYLQQHPRSWQASYQLGYAYFCLHRNWPSLVALSKSLAINDRFAEAHKILAFDLNILGKQEMARAELERAVALDPSSAESNYELGRIEYERGSYLKAVEHLGRAKELDPAAVRIRHNLGLALAAVGRNDDARVQFEEGLRLNAAQKAQSAWPFIDYGTFLNMRGEFQEARNMLLRAVAVDTRWDQAYFELSKAYRGLNQTAEAIDALKEAVSRNRRKPEYHYVLARLYALAQQPELAKSELAAYENLQEKPAFR